MTLTGAYTVHPPATRSALNLLSIIDFLLVKVIDHSADRLRRVANCPVVWIIRIARLSA
ncbi:hypothetical protein [Mycobacterium asiaticum]|uniref:hypothetical protein n=1 Tax=Mycobacterium asiaticum TaxID=1790 RepID=UPI000B211E8D|nr:hypothetical protein [Mycobacterium asiaticum]